MKIKLNFSVPDGLELSKSVRFSISSEEFELNASLLWRLQEAGIPFFEQSGVFIISGSKTDSIIYLNRPYRLLDLQDMNDYSMPFDHLKVIWESYKSCEDLNKRVANVIGMISMLTQKYVRVPVPLSAYRPAVRFDLNLGRRVDASQQSIEERHFARVSLTEDDSKMPRSIPKQ